MPTDRLPSKPWMHTPAVIAVLDVLEGDGGNARFVGGCVRDSLAGKDVKDVDIATNLIPEQVVGRLEVANIKVVPTGIEHGTVTAVSHHQPIEVTTLRRDVATDGRWAEVAFTDDWVEDASRRDLTFNAMYADRHGTLYDYFGGRQDLRLGRVRFIGEAAARIAEDRLRILRYFRFYALYGRGPVDLRALEAARAAAPEITKLSGERVRGEMLKLLEADKIAQVLNVMQANGILHYALPDAENIARLRSLVTAEGVTAGRSAIRRLAALLPDSLEVARALAERLRLSNADAARLCRLAAPDWPSGVRRLDPDLNEVDRGRVFYRLGGPDSLDLILLAWAETLMDEEDGSRFARFETEKWRALAEAAANWQVPVFPLKGADVVARGVEAGPEVGAVLAEIEADWISARFAWDRARCLVELDERVAAKGL